MGSLIQVAMVIEMTNDPDKQLNHFLDEDKPITRKRIYGLNNKTLGINEIRSFHTANGIETVESEFLGTYDCGHASDQPPKGQCSQCDENVVCASCDVCRACQKKISIKNMAKGIALSLLGGFVEVEEDTDE